MSRPKYRILEGASTKQSIEITAVSHPRQRRVVGFFMHGVDGADGRFVLQDVHGGLPPDLQAALQPYVGPVSIPFFDFIEDLNANMPKEESECTVSRRPR